MIKLKEGKPQELEIAVGYQGLPYEKEVSFGVLADGELVFNENYTPVDGKIQVNLPPGDTTKQYTYVLETDDGYTKEQPVEVYAPKMRDIEAKKQFLEVDIDQVRDENTEQLLGAANEIYANTKGKVEELEQGREIDKQETAAEVEGLMTHVHEDIVPMILKTQEELEKTQQEHLEMFMQQSDVVNNILDTLNDYATKEEIDEKLASVSSDISKFSGSADEKVKSIIQEIKEIKKETSLQKLAKSIEKSFKKVGKEVEDLKHKTMTFAGKHLHPFFSSVTVSGQDTVEPEGVFDRLNLAAGDNITLTTDRATRTVTITGGGGASAFTDLTDVPNAYTGAAGKIVKVNATEDGLEFATGGGGTVSFGTDNQIPYVNAGGTDFDYSSDYTYDGSKLNLTGATQSELANLTATITSNTNNRTLKISTTNNQASGSGTATGGLSVTTTDNGVTSGGAAMATLGMQFTVSRSSTYSNSGLAGTLRAIQGTVTNSGNYIDTASNRSVTVEGSQVSLVTSPTVNTTSTTLTQSTRAFSATMTGTPVITSGSLTADYFGYYLAGTGNTVGTSTLKAFYSSLTGYDTNWTFYNDTANNNFLGNDNSKTYFGTGFDASIYYDGTDLYINPKEVGSGNLIVSGDVSVTDEAYDATNWNGSLEVPTKNAIRDKIESLSAGSGITRTVVVTSGSVTMGASASTDYIYFVAGAHTLSMPSPNTNRYTVKNNHSANITIDTAGAETIEGAASIFIAPEESVDIASDGTNRFII